jgi:hypothetical protein
VKKNLQRTYASWGPEFITGSGQGENRAKALFALAWFHAVVQERRTFIPQGWAKFYEFSDADLRAAAEVIQQLFKKGYFLNTCWHKFFFFLFLLLLLTLHLLLLLLQ